MRGPSLGIISFKQSGPGADVYKANIALPSISWSTGEEAQCHHQLQPTCNILPVKASQSSVEKPSPASHDATSSADMDSKARFAITGSNIAMTGSR